MSASEKDLILALHDLPSAAGSVLERTIDFVAPQDLGVPMLQVKPGTLLHLKVTLNQINDGVMVYLCSEVELHGQCSRCLEDIHQSVDIDISELFFEPGKREKLASEGDEEAEDICEITAQNTIDLEPLLRDGLVLNLPFQPVCDVNCEGLCQECGVVLASVTPDHHHEIIDPRWALLAQLKNVDSDKENQS